MDMFLTYRIHEDDDLVCNVNYSHEVYDLGLIKRHNGGEISIFASARTLLQIADEIYEALRNEGSSSELVKIEQAEAI